MIKEAAFSYNYLYFAGGDCSGPLLERGLIQEAIHQTLPVVVLSKRNLLLVELMEVCVQE